MTRSASRMGMSQPMRCVVGIADHTARAILVTVTAIDARPRVIDRREVQTLDPALPSAPYEHEATDMPLVEAQRLIDSVIRSAAQRSHAALLALRDDLAPDATLTGIAIRDAPAFDMPDSLAEILAARRALFAADGELYRRAFVSAAEKLGLEVALHPRKRAMVAAALATDARPGDVETFLGGLGRELGPPWRKDHKDATAAAIAALAEGEPIRWT